MAESDNAVAVSADPKTQTGRDLIQLAQVVVRLEERAMRELSLSYRQMRILKHLHAGVESATELATRFGVTAPAISETLESLVLKGLVERKPHPSDRRSVRLALTDTGVKTYLRAQDAEDMIGHELLEPLLDRQIGQLAKLLDAVLAVNQARLLDRRRGKA